MVQPTVAETYFKLSNNYISSLHNIS